MDAISDFGITLILFLQSLGDWLVTPMLWITYLGIEEFYLFIAPVVYWCWDTSLGMRIGLYFLTSASLNGILKIVFHSPRPYWVDTRVQAHYSETTFGIPSGHAQNATVVWGLLAAWINRGWVWVAAGIIIILIGLSRLQLGVHFPIDVIIGWGVGIVLLWALMRSEKRLMAWLFKFKYAQQALIVFAASLAIILIGAAARLALGDWQLPVEWVQNAAQAAPEAEAIDPLALSGLITSAGAFFGFALGGILTKKYGGFNPGGFAWKRALRFIIGILGVFIIWYGLGAIFPRGEYFLAYILRYFRYSLVGMWMAFLAPILFIRLRLAEGSSRG